MEAPRILVYDHTDSYVCDIDVRAVLSARVVEEVGGEQALTITTTQELEKTNRLVIRDGMGVWHEYVVLGLTASHEEHGALVHEYYCVWSLQYDLAATFVNNQYGCGIVPGHASVPQPASTALSIALSGTSRWGVGTVSVTTRAAASFYRRSGWDALKTIVEKWGGELQASITMGRDGVVSRRVNHLSKVGARTATRRFDYGSDLKGITRTITDDVWPCRIVPLGKAQETTNGGYTRRPSIESVNGGVLWLQDDEAVPYVRIPDGNGGWEYPTSIITNDTYEEPADLLAWARAHITDYTRPVVSYEAEVVQFVQAGLDPHGVALGDNVVVVDKTFGGEGLRITARVIKLDYDLLDPTDCDITIGNATGKLSGQLGDLSKRIAQLSESAESTSAYIAMPEYLSNLFDRMNEQANATGGYTYITEGQGLRTYDRAVTDPLVGAEATSVVEIKGGNIRIANSKTASGDWEWKTVLVSGHIASELVTTAQLVAGTIRSANGNVDINLDTGVATFTDYEDELDTMQTSIEANAQAIALKASQTDVDDLGTRMTEAEASIEVNAQAITSKASQSDLDSLDNRVTSAETSIQQNATSIQSKASQSDLDSLGNRVTSAETSIQQNATSIQSKASQSDLDSLDSRVSTAESNITQNATDISSVVSNVNGLSTRVTQTESGVQTAISTANTADSNASSALSTANDTATLIRQYSGGVLVCKQGNRVGALVNSSGAFDIVAVSWSGSTPTVGSQYISVDSNGLKIIGMYNNLPATTIGLLGYGTANLNYGGTGRAPYFILGSNQLSSGYPGSYSISCGSGKANGPSSFAFGNASTVAKAAIGGFAGGYQCNATGIYSAAFGWKTTAGYYQLACGAYNASVSTDSSSAANWKYFVVGIGTSSAADGFVVDGTGTASAVNWGNLSDRRVKDHLAYLDGEQAAKFISELKPVLYREKATGKRHIGFYAQDVEAVDPWETETVREGSLGNDAYDSPLKTLDYQALIAPLVATVQRQERRIAELEQRLAELEARIERL
jgi:hypothetical protein